jgi:hypothetical protein
MEAIWIPIVVWGAKAGAIASSNQKVALFSSRLTAKIEG